MLDLQWEKIGPPNRYSYEIANITTLPHSLERFLNLCQSKNMFKLLHNYTDLDLDCESASMKFELQRWTPGCYSVSEIVVQNICMQEIVLSYCLIITGMKKMS